MKTFRVAAVFALVIGAVLSAQGVPASPTGPQSGPDLSGRWNRDSASASPGSTDSAGWGPRIAITQAGVYVTVQPSSGQPSRFRLDGKETAEAIAVDGCRNTTRITKAVTSGDKVTITTWIAVKPGCVHGEDEDDPRVTHIGVIDVQNALGRRKLESISDVYRQGDRLTVETTRSTLGETTTTTTTYRK